MKSGTATLLGWPCRENRPTTSANARSMQRSREEQRRGAGGQRPEGSAEERRGAVEDRGGGGGGVGHLLLADSFGVLAGISFYLSLFQGDHADQGRPALLRRGEQVRSETPVQKRLFICSLPFLVLPPSNARASLRQAGAVLQGGHTTRNSAPALSSVPRHSLSIQTWLSKDCKDCKDSKDSKETHRSGWPTRGRGKSLGGGGGGGP